MNELAKSVVGTSRTGIWQISRYVTVLALGIALLAAAPAARAGLEAAGPPSPHNGYPLWYMDETGLTLELCLDASGNCLLEGAVELNFPGESFPDNYNDSDGDTTFEDEAFWWAAESFMDTNNGGRAILVLALEAAFANEDIVDGDQIAFGRIRIRVDNLQDGEEYTVTTPYGVFEFEADGDDGRGINMSDDFGALATGNFSAALGSGIGPFLVWDPDDGPAAPAGYVGDPAQDHTVIGSPNGTNFFRIEGPVGLSDSGQFECDDPALGDDPEDTSDCIENDEFAVSGKIATVYGVGVSRASYTGDSTSGDIDVLAFSHPDRSDAISVDGIGMVNQGGGRYFARIPYDAGHPASVEVTNDSDGAGAFPVSADLVDVVTITNARYNVDAGGASGTLDVDAISSDSNGVTLTVHGPDGAEIVVPGASAAVGEVTVTSSGGGSATATVEITGPTAP